MRDTLPVPIAEALLAYLSQIYGQPKFLNGKAPIWVSFTRRAATKRDNELPALTIRSIANICEKHLGVSKVHVTRHTWAHTMESAGAKISDIQARLGHESLATTGRYLAALRQADNPHADTLIDLFGLT
jgi:integrase